MLFLVEGDLEGSDKATLGKKRLAVDLAALEKGLAELLDVLLLELGAELRIRRDGGELVGRGDGLDIEPGAAADDGKLTLCGKLGKHLLEIRLVAVEVVALAGVGDVDHVIGNLSIFFEILPCAYVHAAVDLAGVGGDDLSDILESEGVEGAAELHCVACLAGGRGAEHDDHFDFAGLPGAEDGFYIDDFGIREGCGDWFHCFLRGAWEKERRPPSACFQNFSSKSGAAGSLSGVKAT